MSTETYIALSVAEGALLILILVNAFVRIRRRLVAIASGLATLDSSLSAIERDLRRLGGVVAKVNAPLGAIAAALPGIVGKAEVIAPRFRTAR